MITVFKHGLVWNYHRELLKKTWTNAAAVLGCFPDRLWGKSNVNKKLDTQTSQVRELKLTALICAIQPTKVLYGLKWSSWVKELKISPTKASRGPPSLLLAKTAERRMRIRSTAKIKYLISKWPPFEADENYKPTRVCLKLPLRAVEENMK